MPRTDEEIERGGARDIGDASRGFLETTRDRLLPGSEIDSAEGEADRS